MQTRPEPHGWNLVYRRACCRVVGRSRGAGRAAFDQLELPMMVVFVFGRLPEFRLDASHLTHGAPNFVGRLERVSLHISSSVCEYV
jgi:hypothetical protein